MDDDTFDHFYLHDYAVVVAAVAAVTGDVVEARDAVDEAAARAWERARRDRMPDSLPAWIRVVALNVARGRLRRRGPERRARERLAASSRGSHDAPDAIAVDVRRALARLSRRQREVAALHYLCDVPVADIAAQLRISDGTVKSMLHRARAALAEILTTEVCDDTRA